MAIHLLDKWDGMIMEAIDKACTTEEIHYATILGLAGAEGPVMFITTIWTASEELGKFNQALLQIDAGSVLRSSQADVDRMVAQAIEQSFQARSAALQAAQSGLVMP